MMDIDRKGKTEKAKEEKTKEKEESGSIVNVSHHITNRKSTLAKLFNFVTLYFILYDIFVVDGPFKKKNRKSVVNAQSSEDKDY
uniref:Uncharacterized protein n=1 Tax=Amphimedon queenslandica TaxID=400682 RepID=A0A1X7THP1_AMPQE